MRLTIAAVLVASGVMTPAASSQGGAPGKAISANGACSLLTKDVLAAHTPAEKQSFTLMLSVPPMEDKVGVGTSCSYGGVTIQVDPFPVANFEKVFGKFTPVSGVGDRAYFRENRNTYAELAVLSGSRMLTIQMGTPTGKTPASIQSNTVGLAKAILAKLK